MFIYLCVSLQFVVSVKKALKTCLHYLFIILFITNFFFLSTRVLHRNIILVTNGNYVVPVFRPRFHVATISPRFHGNRHLSILFVVLLETWEKSNLFHLYLNCTSIFKFNICKHFESLLDNFHLLKK